MTAWGGTYNVEQSMHSILNQTHYTNFEFLIAYNQDLAFDARDTLNKVVRDYAATAKVQVFARGGLDQKELLRYLVEQAKGEYIAIHAADAWMMPDRLAA